MPASRSRVSRPTVNVTGPEPTDHLQVNGLGGDDDVSVDDAVVALIAVDVDLGAQN